MRGFGFQYDCVTGRTRNWYSGPDGIKRWADNGEDVDLIQKCPHPNCGTPTQPGPCAFDACPRKSR